MASATDILKKLYPQKKVESLAYGQSPLLGLLSQGRCMNPDHLGFGQRREECGHPECVVQYVLEE